MKRLRNLYKGKDIIVCGCGPSIAELPESLPIPTIGVNDVWAYHQTRYIMLQDSPQAFEKKRVQRILDSKPEAWLLSKICARTWDKAKMPRKPQYIYDPIRVPGAQITTPSLAVGVAMFMGAKRVGVIGVDLTDHHNLSKRIPQVQRGFKELLACAWCFGVEIWNLSQQSQLDIVPTMTLKKFMAGVPQALAAD